MQLSIKTDTLLFERKQIYGKMCVEKTSSILKTINISIVFLHYETAGRNDEGLSSILHIATQPKSRLEERETTQS